MNLAGRRKREGWACLACLPVSLSLIVATVLTGNSATAAAAVFTGIIACIWACCYANTCAQDRRQEREALRKRVADLEAKLDGQSQE